MAATMASGDYEVPRHPLLRGRRRDTSLKETYPVPYKRKLAQSAKLAHKLVELRREPVPEAELKSPNSWFRRNRSPRDERGVEEEDAIPWLKSPKKNVHFGDDDEVPTHTIPRRSTPGRKPTRPYASYKSAEGAKFETEAAMRDAEEARQHAKEAMRDAAEIVAESEREREAMNNSPPSWLAMFTWMCVVAGLAFLVTHVFWRDGSRSPLEADARLSLEDPLGLKIYDGYVQDAITDFTGVTYDSAGVAHYEGDLVAKTNAEVQYIVSNFVAFNDFWLKSGPNSEFKGPNSMYLGNNVIQAKRLANLSREIELKTNHHIRLLLQRKHADDIRAVEELTEETLKAWNEIDQYAFWEKVLAGIEFKTWIPLPIFDVINRWFTNWERYLSIRQRNAIDTRDGALEIAGLARDLTREFNSFKDELKRIRGQFGNACDETPHKLGQTKERTGAECRDKLDHMLKSSLHVGWEQLPQLVEDVFHKLLHLHTVHGNFAGHFKTLSSQAELAKEAIREGSSQSVVDSFREFLDAIAAPSNISLPDNADAVVILNSPLGGGYYDNFFETLNSNIRISADGKPSSFLTVLNDERQTTESVNALEAWRKRVAKSHSRVVQQLNFSETLEQGIKVQDQSRDLTAAALQLHIQYGVWLNQTQHGVQILARHFISGPEGVPRRYARQDTQAQARFYGDVAIILRSNRKADRELTAATAKVLRLADELLAEASQYRWRFESSTRHAVNVCGLVQRKQDDQAITTCLSPPKFNANEVYRKISEAKGIVQELMDARVPLILHNSRAIEVLRNWQEVTVRNGEPVRARSLLESVERARVEAVSIIERVEKMRNL